MIDPVKRAKILNAIVEYDKKESTKKHYNPHALALCCGSLQNGDIYVKEGKTLRQAMVKCFNGRLLDKVLKAIDEPISTKEEKMGF